MLGFVGQVPRASDPVQKEPSERGWCYKYFDSIPGKEGYKIQKKQIDQSEIVTL